MELGLGLPVQCRGALGLGALRADAEGTWARCTLRVLAIPHVGGVLGRVAVPKYVLAGLFQFLEIVTLPVIPGNRIDDALEYERGPRRLMVWTILTLLMICLMIHEVVDLDGGHRSEGLIDDHSTLVGLEADPEVSEGFPDVADKLGTFSARRKALAANQESAES